MGRTPCAHRATDENRYYEMKAEKRTERREKQQERRDESVFNHIPPFPAPQFLPSSLPDHVIPPPPDREISETTATQEESEGDE